MLALMHAIFGQEIKESVDRCMEHIRKIEGLRVIGPGAVFGTADTEFAIRTTHDDLVAGLQREDSRPFFELPTPFLCAMFLSVF